jgi:hypothetical protein
MADLHQMFLNASVVMGIDLGENEISAHWVITDKPVNYTTKCKMISKLENYCKENKININSMFVIETNKIYTIGVKSEQSK